MINMTYSGKFRLTTALLLVFITLDLAGCGFHLRGDVQIPPEARQLLIEDTETGSEIVPVLEIKLKRNGMTPLKEADQAKLVLMVLSESYKKRVLTVSSQGQVQEYELIYMVKYSIRNVENNQASLMNQSAVIKRDLRFSVTEVLGKATEEARLKQDMITAAAEQILRRLPSVFARKP